MKKSQIGKIGEEISCKYLINNGFSILNRNFRKKFGEIDVIAIELDKTLVFIEVKTLYFKNIKKIINLKPEDNFTTHKSLKVKKTCQFFAAKHPELIDEDKGWRIDLIAIDIMADGKFFIRHYKNV